ncbi:hypothetical protein FLL45_16485 [Aliikangiella marina]|uniref:Cation/multidrug efflux pump n=1 Tax=Aliikangiella marina TaxID=1712262 RepID=A0A545T755_9GAMM|nr:hypothetical protein [Aliikangiella marina]TQV73056.1 hypothetical protein FLL45_16485 [Aliikangiella marina]
MPLIENVSPMIVVASLTGLLSIYYLLSVVFRLKKLKVLGAVKRLFGFMVFGFVTLSITFLLIGTQGYNALTKEELAAKIKVTPTGNQSFHARMEFSDGHSQVFSLKGDELMIDAYVLKWKPWANVLGLHTAYRLDRIRGRYKSLKDEQNNQATVFAINAKSGAGVAEWRQEYSMLSVLLDVEHGSASFVNADEVAEYQLSITTDGLLIRPIVESL